MTAAVSLILANCSALAERVNAQAAMGLRYAEQHNLGAAKVHLADAAELSRLLVGELVRIRERIGGQES